MSNTQKKWFLICVLVAYSAYVLWLAVDVGHWTYWGWGAITVIAALGIGLTKAWAENIIHCIALVTIIGWGYVIWGLYAIGWPYTDAMSSILALIPGLLTAVICIVSSWFVYSLFHHDTSES